VKLIGGIPRRTEGQRAPVLLWRRNVVFAFLVILGAFCVQGVLLGTQVTKNRALATKANAAAHAAQKAIDETDKLRQERLAEVKATANRLCDGQDVQNRVLISSVRRGIRQTRRLHIPGFSDAEKAQSIASSRQVIRELAAAAVACRKSANEIGAPQEKPRGK
jgi:hypothetical protein